MTEPITREQAEQAVEAWREIGRTFQRMGEQLAAAIRPIARAFDQLLGNVRTAWRQISLTVEQQLRLEHGRRNFTDDGRWQSDLCAAWIHGTCPHPELSHCCCTCHGGDMR